jgi:hypothetical protein
MGVHAVFFGSLAVATGLRDAMNTRAGCPIAGVDVGGGIHVPAAQSVTVRVSPVRKHPTLSRWCVLLCKPRLVLWYRAVKAACQTKVDAGTATAAETAIANSVEVDLDGTWDTATEVA